MTFEPTIGLGAIVEIVFTLIGGVGIWFTYKAKLDQLWTHAQDQEKQHEENQKRFTDMQLQMEREFVKKNDLASVEDRIGKRIDTIAHDLKGATAQIIAALAIRPRNPRGQD